MFVFNTIILHHYAIDNDYAYRSIKFAAPGFWILEYQLVIKQLANFSK